MLSEIFNMSISNYPHDNSVWEAQTDLKQICNQVGILYFQNFQNGFIIVQFRIFPSESILFFPCHGLKPFKKPSFVTLNLCVCLSVFGVPFFSLPLPVT